MAIRASSTAPTHHHQPSDIELAKEHQATLNSLPIPAGSWQEQYDKRNSTWNIFLAVSFVVFAGTVYTYIKDTTFLGYTYSDLKKFKVDPRPK